MVTVFITFKKGAGFVKLKMSFEMNYFNTTEAKLSFKSHLKLNL